MSCLSEERNVNGARTGLQRDSTIKIATIFPKSPIITKGGTLKITTIITDHNGNFLQSSVSDPIIVGFESSNKNIARVDETGVVFGKGVGKATISMYATQGSLRSEVKTVDVLVVNQNGIEVAEIYFSQNGAYIDLGAKRNFRLTAVDAQGGTPASLSEGTLGFTLSNDNVAISDKNITLKPGEKPVEIALEGLSKGYTFVTPTYSIQKNGEIVTITGTPLVVQVKDPTQSSKPSGEDIDGGNYLSLFLEEDEGKKLIHVGHYDKALSTAKTSHFDASWYHDQSSIPMSKGGVGVKLALSPFKSNKNKEVLIMLQDNKPVLWYQTWPSGGWLDTSLNDAAIFNDTHPYQDGKRLLDIAVSSKDGKNVMQVAYYDAINQKICVQTRSSMLTTSFKGCNKVDANVTDLSLDSNALSGEPRLAYIEKNNAIFYLTVQDGKFYKEKIEHTDGTEKAVRLKLNNNNAPSIVTFITNQASLLSRIKEGTKNRWTFKNVTAEKIPKDIIGIDLAFDNYNEPRIVFSSDEKVKYARRTVTNGDYRWLVDIPSENVEGVQGKYCAIFVDSSNRAHIVYSNEEQKWFSYWAEPKFFDYRNFPKRVDTGADVIRKATQ